MLLTIGDLVEELTVELADGMRRGRVAEARTIRVRGGSAANVAAITCERGGAARFVGQAGADAMGASLVADLRRRGVDARVSTHGVTGVVINLLQAGYRTTLVDRGASANLNSADDDVLHGVVQLFVPARSLLADPLATVVEGIVATAQQRRVPMTLTGLSADEVAYFGAAAFLDLVATLRPDAVIFTARDHARLELGPDEPVEGSGSTVVLGSERTAVITADGLQHRRSSPPTTVMDRTGATDGFVAGYLMSRRAGATHVAAVDAAHRVMSLVMARPGPTTVGDPLGA
ncbi:MAG: carbohydrate kinase family protein [Acidimicrobiaceae bacterium]|nr:carbohydrate kinase family protein [Acidimicrobiaceae bacterium]MYL02603.1 carbohydrate kinase family protein [Acidimicrobiaceae bacterium]